MLDSVDARCRFRLIVPSLIFFSPTPENLNNPEKVSFPGYRGYKTFGLSSCRPKKKKCTEDLKSTPQKTFIEKEKAAFFLCAHEVK